MNLQDRLEAAEKEIAAIKAEMEKPPCPFKVGDRVVPSGYPKNVYTVKSATLQPHGVYSVVAEIKDHNIIAVPSFYRPATPAEIAREEFGLAVGDEVELPGGRKDDIRSFTFNGHHKDICAIPSQGRGWPCSELKKVQPPEAPKPRFAEGDVVWVKAKVLGIASPGGNVWVEMTHKNGCTSTGHVAESSIRPNPPIALGEPGGELVDGMRVMVAVVVADEMPNKGRVVSFLDDDDDSAIFDRKLIYPILDPEAE